MQKLDVCGRVSLRDKPGPKTSNNHFGLEYHGWRLRTNRAAAIPGGRIYDTGSTGMFASEDVARSTFRRQVLYGCAQHQDLLPLDLPCPHGERKECALLSICCGCGGSWLPPLSALPAGMFAGHSGVAGH